MVMMQCWIRNCQAGLGVDSESSDFTISEREEALMNAGDCVTLIICRGERYIKLCDCSVLGFLS